MTQTDPLVVDVTVTNPGPIEVEVGEMPAPASVEVVTMGNPGKEGPPGPGVPGGGQPGQVLAKATATDFDTEWVAQGSVVAGVSQSYVDAGDASTASAAASDATAKADAAQAAAIAASAIDATAKASAAQTASTAAAAIDAATKADAAEAAATSRGNHTGTQLAATIADLDSAVAGTSAVAANTAKVSFTEAAAVVANSAKISFPEAPQDGGSYLRKNAGWVAFSPSGAPVDSVNGQTGAVSLGADDIDDSASTHKFATAGQLAEIAANTAKVSNVDHPLVETAVPLGAVFTDTVYDDAAIQVEVDANTAKTSYTDAATVAANALKLASIESNATADQTGAEIKTAYEAESNTNAFTDAEKAKLGGVAPAATANDSDASLKSRANHTGSQTASTISDFDSEVASNSAVAANTAKVSYTDAAAVAANTAKTIDDTAYDATSWNGNTDAATKNAIRDKFASVDTSLAILDAITMLVPRTSAPASTDQIWFHTTDLCLYAYDSTRTAWLSLDEHVLELNYHPSISTGSALFYQGYTSTYTATANKRGTVVPFNCTVTGAAWRNVTASTDLRFRIGKFDESADTGNTGVWDVTPAGSNRFMVWDDIAVDFDAGDGLGWITTLNAGASTLQYQTATVTYRRRPS